jgi:hypothetical protein
MIEQYKVHIKLHLLFVRSAQLVEIVIDDHYTNKFCE